MTTAADALDALVRRRFGRRQGLLRSVWAHARFLAGRFEALEGLEWASVSRLVFVGRGNLCRSAYAEARAHRHLGLRAISFGLVVGARSGAPADAVALRTAQTRGVDLSHHRSRAASAVELRGYDLVVAMEPAHLAELRPRVRRAAAQATLLGLWSTPVRPHLEDPQESCAAYFDACFDTIDRALDVVALRLALAHHRGDRDERLRAHEG